MFDVTKCVDTHYVADGERIAPLDLHSSRNGVGILVRCPETLSLPSAIYVGECAVDGVAAWYVVTS